MKKRLKKEFAEVNNQFNTCIDGIDERLKGVKEEFNSMIDELVQEFNGLQKQLTYLDDMLRDNKKRMQKVEKLTGGRLEGLEQEIKALQEPELEAIKRDIVFLENKFEILRDNQDVLFDTAHTHWWK